MDGTDNAPQTSSGGFLSKVVLPVLLVTIGVAAAIIFVKTKPKAGRKPKSSSSLLVTVTPLKRSAEQISVYAMGTVQPAKEVSLQPRVSGEVVMVSEKFIPGGSFTRGEVIMQIDPTDYEIIITQRESDLARADNEYKIELGRQEIARQDWGLASSSGKATEQEKELVLRQPQLRSVVAALKSAGSALKKARLDLARTKIQAPFNAIVKERMVDRGAQVTIQSRMAMLTGYDEYWVYAALPVEKLPWISIPRGDGTGVGSDATVRITSAAGETAVWNGTVVRQLVEIEQQGRMAQILISIQDPLGLVGKQKKSALLLGSYVDVTITGKKIENVYKIPRTALREGNTLWLKDLESKLEIRPVSIVWRERDWVLVRDSLSNGDLLVTSDIPVPAKGIALRVEGEEVKEPGRKKSDSGSEGEHQEM